jgi:hypothetical protein
MMPFRLINALVVLMDLMNHVFQLYLGKLVVMFINDILIYSSSCSEIDQHLRCVLYMLKDYQLYAKLNKYEYWLKNMVFLRHVISRKGVFVD